MQMIVTDSCLGLAAIQAVYPRAAHQRCRVHKMRDLLDKVRKRDYDAVKADAQAIYLAADAARIRPPRPTPGLSPHSYCRAHPIQHKRFWTATPA